MACEGEDVLLVVLILRDDEVKLAEISTAEGAGAVAAKETGICFSLLFWQRSSKIIGIP